MSSYKVTVNREACIGCGTCAAICESNFEIDTDNKAKVKNEIINDLGCSMEAAENCPAGCINIEELE